MAKPGKAAKKAKQLTKGHVVTKLEKKARPSNRKGKLSKRTETVRSVIRDVTGFAPYERKILELLQAGSSKDEKKALKVAKRRVGTHRRGMRKREYMRGVMQRLRHK